MKHLVHLTVNYEVHSEGIFKGIPLSVNILVFCFLKNDVIAGIEIKHQ